MWECAEAFDCFASMGCEGNLLYTYYLWECGNFALHLLSVGMRGNLFTLILPAMGMRDHITLQLLFVRMSDYNIAFHLFSCSFLTKLPCQSCNKSVNYLELRIYPHACKSQVSTSFGLRRAESYISVIPV